MAVAALALAAAVAAGGPGASWLRRMAREAGLAEATVVSAARSGDGAAYTASGFGRYEAVEAFVARVERAATLERLTLSAISAKPTASAAADAIRWEAEVRVGDRAPAPRAVPLLDPLAAFALEFDPGDVGVTEAVLGDTFRVSGYKLLPGPAASLPPILEATGLEVTGAAVSRDGPCERFDIEGRALRHVTATVKDEYRQPPQPARLFDDAALCATNEVPPSPLVIQEAGAAGGAGPYSLRLRDVDVAEMFGVVHELTGESFVLDQDVAGRVTVELAGVSTEEVLRAIEGPSLRIAPAGRLRRVSASPRPPLPERRAGDPISLAFARTDLRDVLRLFEDITAFEIRAPEGDLGSVSVFVREVPWEEVLYAMLEASGFTVRVEGERRLLLDLRAASTRPAAPPDDADQRGARLRQRGYTPRTDIVAEPGCQPAINASLAGVACNAGECKAVLRRVDGHLGLRGAGFAFCDGTLQAVDAKGIAIQRGPVLLRAMLPPP